MTGHGGTALHYAGMTRVDERFQRDGFKRLRVVAAASALKATGDHQDLERTRWALWYQWFAQESLQLR